MAEEIKPRFTVSSLNDFYETYMQRGNMDSVLIIALIEELLLYKKTINEFNGGRRISGSKMNREDYSIPISTKDVFKIQQLAEDQFFRGDLKITNRETGEVLLEIKNKT